MESSGIRGHPERVGLVATREGQPRRRLLRRRGTRRSGAGRDTLIPDEGLQPRHGDADEKRDLIQGPAAPDAGQFELFDVPIAVVWRHRWRANDHRRAAGPDAISAGLEALGVTDRAGWNPQALARLRDWG